MAGRDVGVPFCVLIECRDQPVELVCERAVRILPGKRLTCFGHWNGQPVAVKFFLDPINAKKHCLREERGIKALTESGIKTPTLLVKGLIEPDNFPVLIFQRVESALDLAVVWQRTGDGDDSQAIEILRRLIAVLADLHSAGLKQDDMHLGNFLWTGGDFYAVDGATVDTRHMGEKLPERESLKNLALFLAQLSPDFDRLVPNILQIYFKRRAWPNADKLHSRVVKEVQAHKNFRKKVWLKKIFRDSSVYVCRRTWGRFMVCRRDLFSAQMARFLTNPDIAMDSGRLLKKGNTATLALVEIDGRKLVVKRYNIKNTRHAIKRCLRRTRASLSWRNAHLLEYVSVPTLKPIALLEMRHGPFRSTSYFISEYLDGMDAYHFFHTSSKSKIEMQRLIREFGDLLQRLVQASISHGDFKATNFLITNIGLRIVDLDALREHRYRWRFRRSFNRDCRRLMRNWSDLPEIAKIFRVQLARLEL